LKAFFAAANAMQKNQGGFGIVGASFNPNWRE
jgi:hypothetical protein